MLLSSNATGTAERARERQPLTPIKTCKSYLSAVSRPPQGGIGPSPGRGRRSIEAPRFHQEGKRIEVEICLEITPEQTEPSLLRHVGELFALLRACVLEPAHVLNMMDHFVYENRELCRGGAGPALEEIDRLRRRPRIATRRILDSGIGEEPLVAQGGDLRAWRQHYAGRTIDARKVEVEHEPGFDRGQQRPLEDKSRFSLLPLDLACAGRPRIDRRGHRAGGERAPQQSSDHL